MRYGLRSLVDPPVASVIAIAAECGIGCDSARHAVSEFSARALPVLLPGLGPAGKPSLH
jgi:hypothetical protein